ncbi:MAG: methionine--tRNA ligase [Nitrospirae bacterium]|nr:methionine--tRNA ligase [Candidatus Troglogloeales bacterium]
MNKKPRSGHATFYITTPIYYVNDTPHIGHAYTTVAADVLARYHRALGEDVFFLTGVDEHGQKVAEAAAKTGISPKEHVDKMVVSFQDLLMKLNISNNDFVRTTESRHQETVKNVLMALWKKGEIYEGVYEGWYCIPDERFFPEKDLIDGKCPDCHREVSPLSEKNYFFKMGKYQNELRKYVPIPGFIEPSSRRNEILGFLEKPLGDLCISRPKSRLSWGIPIPFDPDYVTYVWFDALVNYISMRGYDGTPSSLKGKWPADIHLVGKDILTTHAVYWSTMLMALGLPLPKKIFAHGWWTVDEAKMSKSRGNVVDPTAIIKTVGVDAFRYFLLREVPFGDDGNFSQDTLLQRYNSDLANDLGNLVSRVIHLTQQNSNGIIPEPAVLESHPEEESVKEIARNLFDSDALLCLDFHRALTEIWKLIDRVNRYVEEIAPWKLKKPSEKDKLNTFLYTSAEAIRVMGVVISPFMPQTAENIAQQLGLSEIGSYAWGDSLIGKTVQKGDPLFPRIERKKPIVAVAPLSVPTSQTSISIEDFGKLDLRVGIIKEAERIPKSDKLLKLRIGVGLEMRQVVAGIATKYQPEALIGKSIVLVYNLAPAKIRGVLSEGMLLAAGDESVLGLATFLEGIPSGTKIK